MFREEIARRPPGQPIGESRPRGAAPSRNSNALPRRQTVRRRGLRRLARARSLIPQPYETSGFRRRSRTRAAMGHSGRYGRFKSSRAADYATSTTRTAASAISYLSWKAWALLLSRRPSLSPPRDGLSGEKSLDQLVNSLSHDGWWSASGSLRARQHPYVSLCVGQAP